MVSRFGVHLIQLIERRQEKLTEREQREMVRNVVRDRETEQDYETWLKELRGKGLCGIPRATPISPFNPLECPVVS